MDFFEKIIYLLPSILIALTVHEFFHGWTAWQFGDPTAKYENRLTLNPIVHLDPYGAAMMLITALWGFPMGWAKPVPVVRERLTNPKISLPLVALAGPVSNLILAFLTGRLLNFGLGNVPFLTKFLLFFCMVNIGLACFNMLPIPPLDGWKIIQIFLPDNLSYRANYFVASNPKVAYGMLLFVVLFSGSIMSIPCTFLFRLFTG